MCRRCSSAATRTSCCARFATAQRAERTTPYRGHEGVHAYLRDVADVWEELTLTPLTFRHAQESVIGFGRVEGRRPGERVLGSIMWMVRLAATSSRRSRSSRRPAARR